MAMNALPAPLPAIPPDVTAEPADAVDAFLRLSAALTGFDRVELLGTGMVPRYYHELTRIIGAQQVGALLAAAGRVESGHPASGEDFDRAFRERILDDNRFGPVARRVVTMWYIGRGRSCPGSGATPTAPRRSTWTVSSPPPHTGKGWRGSPPALTRWGRSSRVSGPGPGPPASVPAPARPGARSPAWRRTGERAGGDGRRVRRRHRRGRIAGATAAKIIADHGGKRILILEACRSTGMSSEKYRSHVTAYHEALAKVPNSPYADNPDARSPRCCPSGSCSPAGGGRAPAAVPDTGGYLVQTGPPPFSSDYTRALGGTTLHWLGTCLRMLPNDFSLRSVYGHGVDWPIGYGDLRGFYERAEREIIGVAGDVADQRYPGIDGTYFGGYEYPMERIPPSYLDQVLAGRLDGQTITVQDHDYEVRLDSVPAGRNSTPRDGYQVVGAVGNPEQGQRCEGNSSCVPICPVQAKYSALKTLYDLQRRHPATAGPAGQRSSVRIVSQAVASRVLLDEHGRVSGIAYRAYDDEGSPGTRTGSRGGRSTSWRPTPSRTRRCCWPPARRTPAAWSAGT